LLFTCCHPALSVEARVALALRALCGLTTQEIARAFLVTEATMAQRIVRAKRKISRARIPYRVPSDADLPERLPGVLAVVYLVFTEAHHSASDAALVRVDLGDEAIRLARLLVDLMPDEPECGGLLALLLATHARRATRLDERGEIVLIADQDRGRWDRAAIDEAAELVDRSLRRGRAGPYVVQAAIACLHGVAASASATDWPQIAELYGILERLMPTPVVQVNRAAAVAEASGAAAGLQVLDRVHGVDGWHLYHSARGELLRRLDRPDEAADSYRAALACECNDVDRRFLERRLTEVTE
jgi:RNA polymerase sigma-70 factor (ECF subfamily)